MKLEEAIKKLKMLSEKGQGQRVFWEEDLEYIRTVLHYIKEESIPRAVVEEKIKGSLFECNNGCGVWWYQLGDYTTAEEFLQEILNKGEKEIC